ncbi:spermidine synthase [Lachnospira multipara]|uniref:spermidine synthase n=1 Tax=Lachnospira multipara TaxID=28051 RepID=UPI00048726A3|nr:fused MFS/spermidine synthase [Lachnospira multipara]
MAKQINDDERNLYKSKSRGYGKIMVRDVVEDGKEIRILMVNFARESACLREEGHHHELLFKYTRQFENIFNIKPDIKETLLIGGAGMSYPKYYIKNHQGCKMDVVEINPEMVEIAHKYFYIDEFMEGDKDGALNIYVDDGMKFLSKQDKKYDCIINDAYIGNVLDSGLMSYRGVAHIKRHLNTGGIYIVNIITALSGFYANDGKIARQVFDANFKNVAFYTTRPESSPLEKQNCILIGTDSEIPALELL